MARWKNVTVSGFYPWPVPVSLSEEAAVFVRGGSLYQVDSRMNVQNRDIPGEISQVVQTEAGIYALEWTGRGEAALLQLDDCLQTVRRRVLFQGGAARMDRMPDPFDLEDWRNQKDFCLLTEEGVFRLSFRPFQDSPDLTEALILERIPLGEGETVRREIGGPELESALGGDARFNYLDVRAGDTQMWAWKDQVFLHVDLWDWNTSGVRHLLLQLKEKETVVLWDSQDVLAGRPCFFDFDQGVMWTYPRPGEVEFSGRPPMVARNLAKDAPILPQFPVWQDVALMQPYFDGVHDLPAQEDGPVVWWQDRLLTDFSCES